ncbi:MAG: aminopeptidase P N-terminal domain-containing protein, partial [Myxococcales bacterium]|nr:aminopeptidase P N-terminal domain-containing protein [Myxococcales bacterium]
MTEHRLPLEIFAQRRRRFADRMGEGVALILSAPVFPRNRDVEHPYRQHSDFYYLTGLDEPGSALVLSSRGGEVEARLFVRPRDPERETWHGARAGIEGAVALHGADEAFAIGELDAKLPELLSGTRRLLYALGEDEAVDRRVVGVLRALRGGGRRAKPTPDTIVEPGAVLHELRLRKSEEEIELMRGAAKITAEAHRRAFEIARPGMIEYEVEAEILRVFRARGAERPAYESIVGSGPNATVLHYVKNDRRMQAGDLLLIDAGCELGYYAADVTRTFPISGRFTEAQRLLYGVVLRAQKAAIEAVRPGVTLESVHELTTRLLTEGMISAGLLEGEAEARIEAGDQKRYYMHRTSHWLGMDVHDVGSYFVDGEPRILEPGMVLTIEPGLYVPTDADAPEALRG